METSVPLQKRGSHLCFIPKEWDLVSRRTRENFGLKVVTRSQNLMANLHAGKEQIQDGSTQQDSNLPSISCIPAGFMPASGRTSDSLKNDSSIHWNDPDPDRKGDNGGKGGSSSGMSLPITMLSNLNNDPDRKGKSGGNGGTTSGMTLPTFKYSNNNDDPPRKGNYGGPGGSGSGRSFPLFTRVKNLTQGIWNPEFHQQLVEASARTVGAEVNLQL